MPLVAEDTQRYKVALEETGGIFGGIEPVHRFFETFQGPVDAAHAAAAVGLEPEAFLEKIRENVSLRRLGLGALESENGNVKRDAWTSNFADVISALNSPDAPVTRPIVPVKDLRPGDLVSIPDVNLRAAIVGALGKAPGAVITSEDMAKLTRIEADEKGIRDLTGLEYATKLERIEFRRNAISDLSPLAGLTRLADINLPGNEITDLSPLAGLINVGWMGLDKNQITDLSPLKGLVKLNGIAIEGNPISDISPLAGLLSLQEIRAWRTLITDFSPLANARRLRLLTISDNKSLSSLSSLKGLKSLKELHIHRCAVSDLSGLEALTQLTSLTLPHNLISDVSALKSLKALTHLNLEHNLISDVSPLKGLTRLKGLYLDGNAISDVSPLAGLTNLEELGLNNNTITDLSPLEELAKKIFISLDGNPGASVQGGPKITGPWLWAIVPGRHLDDSTDFLARATGGAATELEVATNGAKQGKAVGDRTWRSHLLSATDRDNINQMTAALGWGTREEIYDHIVYGSVILYSPEVQQTTMLVGNDDAVKVWLNGELVHKVFVERGNGNYRDTFPVTLKQGKNVLLVALDNRGHGAFSGFFGFAPDAEYRVLPPGTRFSLSTESTQVEGGDTFTVYLKVEEVTDLAGWQTDIAFDSAVLKADSVIEGPFLKQNRGRTYFQRGTIDNTAGRIKRLSSARLSEGGISGEGTLLSVKFTAIANGRSTLSLRNFQAGSSMGETISATPIDIAIVVEADELVVPAWDVNEDGITDATDVQLITAALGQSPPVNPRTDVNGDGVVDGKDLILVAEHLGEGTAPAAPSAVVLPLGFTPGNG